jgi:uncharacterized membrane protein YhhN
MNLFYSSDGMSVMNIFLIVFAIVSVIHIVSIILHKEKLRYVSKALIIPPLLAAYIVGMGSLYFPIPALVLGWMGDILLLRKEKRSWLKLGLVSFLLGHICYMITFIQILGFASNINITAMTIFTPQAIVLGIVVFRLIKPFKEFCFPIILYMFFLVTMALFGFQVFLINPGFGGLLIISGCFNFMISDTILAYYNFRKYKISGAVLIMLFYILAQAEIILGLLAC